MSVKQSWKTSKVSTDVCRGNDGQTHGKTLGVRKEKAELEEKIPQKRKGIGYGGHL